MNPHGAVLLDRVPRQPARNLTIFVPRGYEQPDGPVLIGTCHVCSLLGRETKFYAGEEQAWQRHVGDCARRNIDEIRARAPSEKNKGTLWDPNVWDKELDDYMVNVVGARMRREHRFEVKPNERAGFS